MMITTEYPTYSPTSNPTMMTLNPTMMSMSMSMMSGTDQRLLGSAYYEDEEKR